MKYIQCEMPSIRSVVVRRPGMKSLAADVYSPVAVPETPEERASLGDRFVPLPVAQLLVERGMKAWVWVDPEGVPAPGPAPLLAQPIADDFPHAAALRAAGFQDLSQVPTSMSELTKIQWLGAKHGLERATKADRTKAATEILDALDAIVRKEGETP